MSRLHRLDFFAPIPRGHRVTIYLLKKDADADAGERVPLSCRVVLDHVTALFYGCDVWKFTNGTVSSVLDPIGDLNGRKWRVKSTIVGVSEGAFVDVGSNGSILTGLVVNDDDGPAPYR